MSQVWPMLPGGESLTVEFKSDRKRLPDDELIQALVCLANSEGGELWLGVEDDATPTGLHAAHANLTGLPGLIAARTSPALQVTVESFDVDGVTVARILVPKATHSEIATTSGQYLRRRIKQDGTPECVAMLPHERTSRSSSIGIFDASAQVVAGATVADFDPIERERLRQAVQSYGGDRVLLELDDEQLDAALGFTARTENVARHLPVCWSLGVKRQFVTLCQPMNWHFRCLSKKTSVLTSSGGFRY
jgi:ATP-dependent DNA helicase RecG